MQLQVTTTTSNTMTMKFLLQFQNGNYTLRKRCTDFVVTPRYMGLTTPLFLPHNPHTKFELATVTFTVTVAINKAPLAYHIKVRCIMLEYILQEVDL
jgi:hypothetical protein